MSLPKILSFIKSKACPNGIASLNVAGKLEQMPTSGDIGAISTTERGAANGVATLDADGKLVQLPAYDYVTEQGTDGIWRYRKWASGTAECWGNNTYTMTVSEAWWANGLWYTSGQYANETFPTGLFVSVPSCQYSFESSPNGMMVLTKRTSDLSNTSTQYLQFCRPQTSSNITIRVSWHAIGKWK